MASISCSQAKNLDGLVTNLIFLFVPTNSPNAVLDRVLGAVGECLVRESVEALLRLRANAEMQGRIEALADKCTDG
jgi:hypothetical protein